jgi:nucleoside-diphosphate-sugar epimerase
MKNILITGSSGFIGKSLTDDLTPNFNLFLPTRNALKSSDLFNDIDAVIHLAGKAHDNRQCIKGNDYEEINTKLTVDLFDRFLLSESKIFIFMSSILVLGPSALLPLNEEQIPSPLSQYAKSKNLAESYILSKLSKTSKKIIIIRVPLVYGKEQKGNLNSLFDFIDKIPFWPLGSYHARKSFCDINNLKFVINKILLNKNMPSGIYHVADDVEYSLNEIYIRLSKSVNRNPIIISIPKLIISSMVYLGSLLRLSFNHVRLEKLSSTLLVSNNKIKSTLNIQLPYGGYEVLVTLFKEQYRKKRTI